MNSLSNRIYDYFVGNFDRLPLDKKIHFASRMWLWRTDATARGLLDDLQSEIMPDTSTAGSLRSIANGQRFPLHAGNASLSELRQPYIERFPDLRATSRLLYWAELLEACYDTDFQPALYSCVSRQALETLDEALRHDTQALAILSTHAVNFLYLYHRYLIRDERSLPTSFWLDIAANPDYFDDTDPKLLQLQIYLLTHAVIGESLFYRRPIPRDKLEGYRQIVLRLENILDAHLQAINLDNKLEFLVCCRLVDVASRLEAVILSEAENSVSPDGDYLIDTLNANKSTYTSFEKSEHRSVLYLMATSPKQA